MRYRRYCYRPDQLSDTVVTELSNRISMLRRSYEVILAPAEVLVTEVRHRA